MRPTDLAAKAGISIPYASMLINRQRLPSYSTALRLWRLTGMKFGALDGLDDDLVKRIADAEEERGA